MLVINWIEGNLFPKIQIQNQSSNSHRIYSKDISSSMLLNWLRIVFKLWGFRFKLWDIYSLLFLHISIWLNSWIILVVIWLKRMHNLNLSHFLRKIKKKIKSLLKFMTLSGWMCNSSKISVMFLSYLQVKSMEPHTHK